MVIYIDDYQYRGDTMYEKYSDLFKVLSDPNRVKIIELLIQGETCGCTLIDKLPISQPTLSHHLKKISEVGLISGVKEGNKMKYYVNRSVLHELSGFLEALSISEKDNCEV